MIDVGQTVGNYVVTALLGQGSMGTVFLAEHPVIGRKVALKAIRPKLSRDVEIVSRFVNEAKAISQIGHDHIVEVTDFGRTSAGDFYFNMEHLEGEPLSETIRRAAPLPPLRAITIAAQIADALGAAHERGIVHCDLKPENILLIERGGTLDFVKVLDFGLAKLTRGDDAEPQETQAGRIIGTPNYMSPEQCDGRNAVEARSDVYALGVILFEMLTGRVPFGGATSAEILANQMAMPAPPARAIVPDLPEELDEVLQCALTKASAERFPSMHAFRAALLDIGRHAGAKPGWYDDVSGGVPAARSIQRAEIAIEADRVPSARTTFREAVGAIEDAPTPPRSPARARRQSKTVFAAMALGAMALLAERAQGRSVWERARASAARLPASIGIIFGSVLHGAPAVASDDEAPAASPLSIEEPVRDAPADFIFHKAGYLPVIVPIIPNVSSPFFALVRKNVWRRIGSEHRAQCRLKNVAPRDVDTRSISTGDGP